MKKINLKSLFLGLVIGILLTSGAVYASSLINSHDVTFSPNDETWDVDNVETALDDLFDSINNANPGSEYLRWNEETGKVQAKASSGTWMDIATVSQLPISRDMLFYDGIKDHGEMRFSPTNSGDHTSTISESDGKILYTGGGYYGGGIAWNSTEFDIKAGDKLHIYLDQFFCHNTACSFSFYYGSNSVYDTIPGDFGEAHNYEKVITLDNDYQGTGNVSILFRYFYGAKGVQTKISKIWIEKASQENQ